MKNSTGNSSTSSIERAARRVARVKKMRQLQARIAPPVRLVDQTPSQTHTQISGRSEKTAAAFKAYLAAGLEDAQLAAVAHGYSLTERSMHKIYLRLIEVGMDRWVRGQHVALSSIATPETLLYIARSRQRNRDWNTIAQGLGKFFAREVRPQELLANA